VRRICFAVALSAVLIGSSTSIANSQTGAPLQRSIPDALAKDCEARILKDNPKQKIVGPFVRVQPDFWLARAIHEKLVLYIAAPTSGPGFMGRIVRTTDGCKYFIRDGKLEFDSLIPQVNFPQRGLLPGEK
jgi:hypothetical protein